MSAERPAAGVEAEAGSIGIGVGDGRSGPVEPRAKESDRYIAPQVLQRRHIAGYSEPAMDGTVLHIAPAPFQIPVAPHPGGSGDIGRGGQIGIERVGQRPGESAPVLALCDTTGVETDIGTICQRSTDTAQIDTSRIQRGPVDPPPGELQRARRAMGNQVDAADAIPAVHMLGDLFKGCPRGIQANKLRITRGLLEQVCT